MTDAKPRHYLDYNATTPVRPEVVEAVAQASPDPDQEANWPKFGRKISEAPTDVVQPRLPSTGLMAQVLGDQSLDACLDAAQAARAYRRSQGLLAARLSRLDVRGI